MTSDRLSKVFQCSKGNTYLCRRIYVHTVQILVYLNPTMYISSSKPLTNDVDIEQQLKSFCVWILFWAIVHILLLVLTSTLNSQLQCFDYSFQMTFNFAQLGLPRLGSTWLSLDWLGFGQCIAINYTDTVVPTKYTLKISPLKFLSRHNSNPCSECTLGIRMTDHQLEPHHRHHYHHQNFF